MICPIYIKTCYSLLESCITPEALVKFAKKNGYESIGIADTGNLHGIVEMSCECAKNNIKLIVGVEINISQDYSCLIYAMNKTGYKNLSYIVTAMRLSNDEYISVESISSHAQGIQVIVMPGIHCLPKKHSIYELGNALNAYNISWYVGCDPRKNKHESGYMSSEFHKPVIAVSKACFLYEDDQIAHDVALCIKHKKYLADLNRPKSMADMKALTPDEYQNLYQDMPFCLENAQRFANMADFAMELRKPLLPSYGEYEVSELRDVTLRNLEHKITTGIIPPECAGAYHERLKYEIDAINQMKFVSYFLIVSDFVRFAKENSVPVGPGRGSGAGSLVAWCLSITDIDPIKFGLVFERFLNPGRVSMPDFDIDFGPSGREKVIQYVQAKYGADSVAGIVTFGSLSSRAVLKDVGRVMQVPYSKTDSLSKRVQVVFGKPDSLADTYKNDELFAKEINADVNLQKVLHIASKLEGLPRHTSAHAAGIIISQQPIYEIIPLMRDVNSQMPLTQVSMQYAEMLGLIKFDFLGLTALEIIQDCIESIQQNPLNALSAMSISSMPDHDVSVFKMLNDGYTAGIFQFEGHGMTKLIHDVHVTNIEDLIAIVSLYRPGPMDNIPLFIKSKRDPGSVKYTYPALESILGNTYGVIIYQEQIIKIAQEIAGFSLSEADLVRRNMGKKKVDEMESMSADFIHRVHVKQGGDLQVARDFFQKQVYPFANYGFNKAHAAAYAMIGYAMAYLKTHHTAQFMATAMTYEQNNAEKLQHLIYEAKRLKIKILPPDINTSTDKFLVKNDDILCSLLAIKHVGMHNVDDILSARSAKSFISVKDFQRRINPNKREMESLIGAGVFDSCEVIQEDLNESLSLFADVCSDQCSQSSTQQEFLDTFSKLKQQKHLLGFYIDETPIDMYPLANLRIKSMSQIANGANKAKIAFMIEECKTIHKSSKQYAICSIIDRYGANSLLLRNQEDVRNADTVIDQVCCCDVEVSADGRLIGSSLMPIEEYLRQIRSIEILAQSLDDINAMKFLVSERKIGDTAIVVYLDQQPITLGKVQCDLTLTRGLKGMKWVANAH